MTVLLTGGTGFVGKHVQKLLHQAGFETRNILRQQTRETHLKKGISWNNYDELTEKILKSRPSALIHLATNYIANHTSQDVNSLINDNILFSAQVFDAAAIAGCDRIINVGTSWQYSNGPGHYSPVNLYAATKQSCEEILKYYNQKCNVKASTIYLPDTYGEGDHRKKIIDLLIKSIKDGVRLKMTLGEQVLDIIHVFDVASAIVQETKNLNLEANTSYKRHFISGDRIRLRDLANKIGKLLDKPVLVNWGALDYRPGTIMKPKFDPQNTISKFSRKKNLFTELETLCEKYR